MAQTARGIRIEPGRKRVRTYLAGQLVADTIHPVLVWEGPHYPVYYLPAADIRAELVPVGRTEHSPSRGDAQVFDVKTASATAPAAALQYPESPLAELRDLVRLDWSSTGSPSPTPGAPGSSSRPGCRPATTCPSPTCGWTCCGHRTARRTARTRAPQATGPSTPGGPSTATSCGRTVSRSRRARRSPGWPASTPRRWTSSWTGSCNSARTAVQLEGPGAAPEPGAGTPASSTRASDGPRRAEIAAAAASASRIARRTLPPASRAQSCSLQPRPSSSATPLATK